MPKPITELELLRMGTEKMIASRPTVIALTRPSALTSDGAGGTLPSSPPTDQNEVERYLSPITDLAKVGLGTTQLEMRGMRFAPTHILVGTHDDDIEEGDYFEIDDRRLTVARVFPDRSYMVKALVGEDVDVFVRADQ